jgi:hypothetical protein
MRGGLGDSGGAARVRRLGRGNGELELCPENWTVVG